MVRVRRAHRTGADFNVACLFEIERRDLIYQLTLVFDRKETVLRVQPSDVAHAAPPSSPGSGSLEEANVASVGPLTGAD